MPDRDIRLYLQDIFDSIQAIEEFTRGFNYDDFPKDRKTVDAVVRNLEVIGEAANKIPMDTQLRYADIPWTKMVSMRNKVIHEYAGIDLRILWQTIKEDLPPLKTKIGAMIKETG